REHRPATLRGPAAASVDLVHVRGVVRRTVEPVVVSELLTATNLALGLDVEATLLEQDPAVRIARGIDETRDVAAGATVDHRSRVDSEQERVIVPERLVCMTPIGLCMRYALADVLDESLASGDRADGEQAPSMDRRLAEPECFGGGLGISFPGGRR